VSNYVWAHDLATKRDDAIQPHAAAWYDKSKPTFSDAIAAVRRALWTPEDFSRSRKQTQTVEISARLLERLVETLCMAA